MTVELPPEPAQTGDVPPMPSAPVLEAAERPAFQWRPALLLVARWALVGLAIYAIGWLLLRAQTALTPFILGLVLAYLLLPIVNRLNHHMPRWLAILLVYIGMALIGTIAVAYVVPPAIDQVRQLIGSIPSIAELEQLGTNLLASYRTSVPTEIRAPLDEAATSALGALQSNLTAYAQSLGGFVVGQVLQVINTVTYVIGLLIIPIWLFFVLNDQAKGSAALNQMLHTRARADFWNAWRIINAVLSNYVRGQLILGLAVGVAVAVGLLILQVLGFKIPYILLLSIVAGITELIPIIGPIIGAVPAVILGFGISPAAGLAVLVLYILIQQLENNILVPRIVGESIGIHPAVLSVLLIAFGQVFGLIGIILSAPVAAIVRDLFIYLYQRLSGATAATARAAVHEYARGESPPEAQ